MYCGSGRHGQSPLQISRASRQGRPQLGGRPGEPSETECGECIRSLLPALGPDYTWRGVVIISPEPICSGRPPLGVRSTPHYRVPSPIRPAVNFPLTGDRATKPIANLNGEANNEVISCRSTVAAAIAEEYAAALVAAGTI
ncbi:hypothetical protein SUGI_1227640 [Cryptomeria japonica]|uniref:Uncharacterized protein n=1 Tax=Cryptomeria japonica TaxID=3369 RepID=A0AAD3NRM1_CRYJA|nr:hypothetical protein SUGI_1227640 [Cryptomeria japonica]